MYLQKISLINFKNFREADISFSENINCFVGNNGAGKTNLLDAIHYLSFCKSSFNPIDSQNIFHGAEFFIIQGSYNKDDKIEKIHCGLKRNQKKQFKRNKKEYKRLADHIGFLPLVMISPEDGSLITGGSESRRKFIDGIICQLDKIYLDNLINYNRVVAQRNSLLKHFAEKRRLDKDALGVWDAQMIELGNKIYEKRLEFIKVFIPIFQKHYKFISESKERVNIDYQSQLNAGDFERLLADNLERDRTILYSSVGVHKDDMVFNVSTGSALKDGSNSDKYMIKKYGSQGQQKSYLIALKLAQFDFIKSVKNFPPILLLDDIFDKLDSLRVQKLIKLVSNKNFGQIFITHTHPEKIYEILNDIDTEYNVYKIEKGMVDKVEI
ncbi:MAG: DNA replication/repair protein RecF [Bacteroidota bacterium]